MRGLGGASWRGARCVLIGAHADIADTLRQFEAAPRGYAPECVGACALDAPGDVIAGAPALGPIEALASALSLVKADALIFARAPKSRPVARAGLDAGVRAGCSVWVASGAGLRPIELEDLLNAADIVEDRSSLAAMYAGKRVLVTGAGGSIGAQTMRQLAALGPARLIGLDSCELNLFNLQHDPALADGRAECVYADVRDLDELRRLFARVRPEIVFHAAALKHVPIVEAHPRQGFLTNVIGTTHVVHACAEHGAALVFVSTDKAVRPTSVMGATKRLAGLYCRARAKAGDLPAIVVRLGNVLGSTGSAAPLFEQQAKAGRPVTVTHPEAQRFFVTVPQAADFLLLAGAVGLAPEAPRGAAYVLEIEDEIPIVELARDVILLSGRRPDIDVPIRFIGLRPGERLREALVAEDEAVRPTAAAHIRAIEARLPDLAALERQIAEIAAAARAGDDEGVRARLLRAVGQAPALLAAAG